jgi:hypothetical protein
LVVLLALPAALPASAGAYGTVLPEDLTTNYPFGWSADRQQHGGNKAPIVLQYEFDYPESPPPGYVQRESCNANDKPDEPVRAFRFKNRNNQYRVQLVFPRGPQNRRMIGADLHDARRENSPSILTDPGLDPAERRDCSQSNIFRGNFPPYGWQAFDDSEWISAPYYVPGDPSVANSGDVFVAMHQEYRCCNDANTSLNCTDPAQQTGQCWFGSITFSRSTSYTDCGGGIDTPNLLGACYRHNTAPGLSNHIIGTIPYGYYKDWGRHGYSESSNVIRGESGTGQDVAGYYFTMPVVSAPLLTSTGSPTAQKSGLCLLRTADLSQPSSWRAWDGEGFNVHPESAVNITPGTTPDDHVCKPILPSLVQPWDLTYNTYLEKYMLLGNGTIDGVTGDFYLLSDDLRNWGDPQLLAAAPSRTSPEDECTYDRVTYPVIIDPNDPAAGWPAQSSNPNFDHPGARPDLYFHHRDLILNDPTDPSQGCHLEGTTAWSPADLARMPIDFTRQRQTTLNAGLSDSTTGFDARGLLSSSCRGSYDPPAAGQQDGCALAGVLPPFWSTATGRIETHWKEGDDVWYGSAFRLPDGFFQLQSAKLLRWGGANGTYGGIVLNGADDSFSLIRGRGGTDDELVRFGGLPHGQWVWLEVHQRLGALGTNALSEVYVNGALVGSSAAANVFSDTGTISFLLAGLAEAQVTNGFLAATAELDRITILGAERGPIGAPPAPTGLRDGTITTLAWNAQPGVTTYRVYRRSGTAGTWTMVSETGATGFDDPSCAAGTSWYRVTSVSGAGAGQLESNVSSALAPSC